MTRFVVGTDVHGKSLSYFVEQCEKERVEAGLLLGDYETDFSPLKETNRKVFMIPGTHENLSSYKIAIASLESNVTDMSSGRTYEIAGCVLVPNPSSMSHPQNVVDHAHINELDFYRAIKNADLERAIVMSHEPARDFGDTAYSLMTNQGIIPGFIALMRNPQLSARIRPMPLEGNFPDVLAGILDKYTPKVFLSGHIHENNAFQPAGKNLKTAVEVGRGELAEHLALSPGPYTNDGLAKFKHLIPEIKYDNWDNKVALLKLESSKASYSLIDLI